MLFVIHVRNPDIVEEIQSRIGFIRLTGLRIKEVHIQGTEDLKDILNPENRDWIYKNLLPAIIK